MNSKTAALLANPACSHIVYPSTEDEQVIEAVTFYAQSGLAAGEAVILITTNVHREEIVKRLKAEAYNVESLESQGQLVFLDAASLLPEFTQDGLPNSALFKDIMDRIVKRASHDLGTGRSRKVRMFGEMVSLLWATHSQAALQLEALWNEVIEAHSVPLFCTYNLNDLPSDVARLHSHSIS